MPESTDESECSGGERVTPGPRLVSLKTLSSPLGCALARGPSSAAVHMRLQVSWGWPGLQFWPKIERDSGDHRLWPALTHPGPEPSQRLAKQRKDCMHALNSAVGDRGAFVGVTPVPLSGRQHVAGQRTWSLAKLRLAKRHLRHFPAAVTNRLRLLPIAPLPAQTGTEPLSWSQILHSMRRRRIHTGTSATCISSRHNPC